MPVDLERRDHVALLTLNNPKALNALSPDMLDELEAHLEAIAGDPGLRAVIVTGAGEKAFCAGADIAHMAKADPIQARAYAARGHQLTGRVERLPKPVIAAVNGYALGGGSELALACDIRVAADSASFAQPEINLGILPGWGGTQRLALATSPAVAKELILTGRRVGAEEALRLGLVTHVHPAAELIDRSLSLAAELAAKPAWAAAAAKALCNLALGGVERAATLEREVDAFAMAFATPDQREGMAAFFERRPAHFEGLPAPEGAAG